ncbi:MAG TPA: hypothetical protein VKX17_25555 [Planctomycetota bacterium]|nr:hypothetical protein [Planctomycetota bacterium]
MLRKKIACCGLLIGALFSAACCADEKSGLSWMLPDGITSYSQKVDTLFTTLMYTTIFVFGIVLSSLLYFCVRYRRANGGKAFYTHGDSWKATAVTGTLAMMVFIGIDMNTVRLSKAASADIEAHPDLKDAYRVQVVAKQFAWIFRYPGEGGKFAKLDMKKAMDPKLAKENGDPNWCGVDDDDPDDKNNIQVEGFLVVPANKPVVIEIRSKDVIHSLYIPVTRIRQDAVPGMKTSIWFMPLREGRYEIACSQLCGAQHSQMGATMLVLKDEAECNKYLKQYAKQ